MNTTIIELSYIDLALSAIPVVVFLIILVRWSLNISAALYAIVRMLIQLLLVGYFLAYIFVSDSAWLILAILLVMVLASSWIALGTVKSKQSLWFQKAFCSILVSGGCTLFIITQLVLDLSPWYAPHYMIPIAGMIFAGSMNSVSLSAERLTAEMSRSVPYHQARSVALQAALIPIINSLLAVGLVTLPGMMTGQILSGISPLIAARYQIMVMCMLFGSSGLSVTLFLALIKDDLVDRPETS